VVARSVIDHSIHTPDSDPGRHAGLLVELPTDPAALSEVARNVIAHYRAAGHLLPIETRDDINLRWLEDILEVDQRRHDRRLADHREVSRRVQGCCRDHTLLCVGALRAQGLAARSRVGFAGYLVDEWHSDHVIVEMWREDRWVRFDPEIASARPSLPIPTDIGPSEVDGPGFVTAAEAWVGYRRGRIEPDGYGAEPGVPRLRGASFIFDKVLQEVAGRFGQELLLWDSWGRIGTPSREVRELDAVWLDPIAEMLITADRGDEQAERALLDRYRTDLGLRVGDVVRQLSPYGDPAVDVRIGWRDRRSR
jgi:hypothetical protein